MPSRPIARRLIPLGIFVAIAALLGIALTLNAERVPSPFIGERLPAFEVQALRNAPSTVSPADFKGQVWLLNVWATWCMACRQEHGILLRAAREYDVTIVGLNYKDERPKAIAWLERLGDPYVATAFDPEGEVGMDLGVYGAPETYLIGPDGIVHYKHIGPITPTVLRDTLLPRVRELRAGELPT